MQLLFSLLDIMFILPWERALSLQEEGVPELPGEAHQVPQRPPLSFKKSACSHKYILNSAWDIH